MKLLPTIAVMSAGALLATTLPATAVVDTHVSGLRPLAPASKSLPPSGHNVPAGGNTDTGVWTLWSPNTNTMNSANASRSTITMPAIGGIALLGDWNGDGVATPGRYAQGQWSITNSAVKSGVWQSFASLGGDINDVPITADTNGDGTSDIGVFNSGTWTWQSGRTQQFGAAGDVPVTGDWDGNGKDDIGVVRGNLWMLLLTNTAKKPKLPKKRFTTTFDPATKIATITFTFGGVSNTALAGDWDGDGTATPATVTPTGRWTTMTALKKPKKTVTADFTLPPGSVPLVGHQVTPPGSCPTATRASTKAGTTLAKAVKQARTPQGTRKIDGNQEILSTLRDGLGFVITSDKTKRLKNRARMPFNDSLTTERNDEESIRRSANTALSSAILMATMKKPKVRGVSDKELLDYTRWQIRSIACQHGSNTNNGWGETWQSALWATTTAQAAYLIWNELSPNEKATVANMIVAEANTAAKRGPRYFRDRAGNELTPGDSQSDTVSWDLLAPTLAHSMFPEHKHAKIWKESAIAMSIAAFARPGDLNNDRTVNGVNVNLRLPGTNANEDGTVTNHGKVNPDYTQNVQHLWWAATTLRSANQAVPEAFFFNADIVYRALAVVNFPSPPYAAPGGTVYQPGGQIYYPMGKSWGTRRPATFVGVDGFANVYSAQDTNAGFFLAEHAYDTRGMQQRFTTGQIYAPGNDEDSYKLGKEEYALQQLALAWWAGAWKLGPKLLIDTKAYPNIKLDGGYDF